MKGNVDRTVVTGMITTVAITIVSLIVFTGQTAKLFNAGGDRTVLAHFADARQLKKGDQVRLRGVKVGKVTGIQVADDRRTTLVEMQVDGSDVGDLFQDARASLRWRLLLGGSFYIALNPGTPTRGALGDAAIPLAQTSTQVELDDVASLVQGDARTGLQQLPGGLAATLADPDVPAGTLDTAQRYSPEIERAANGLRGLQPATDLRALIDNTEATVGILARSPDRLRTLVSDGAITLQTLADNESSLRSTLRQAPAMMQETNATLDRLRTTLDLASPVVRDLRTAAPAVAPTFRVLQPTLTGADQLLQRARPLLIDLDPTLTSVVSLSQRGFRVLGRLRASIERLEGSVIPAIASKWPENGISTTVMIGAGLGGLAGIAQQRDANGRFVRFPLTAGSGSLLLPCQAFPGNPDFAPEQQVACQSLSSTLEQVLAYNPLAPAPGSEPRRAAKGGSK